MLIHWLGNYMRILTHNTYWFQGNPPRWGKERVAEVPEVLNALIDLYSTARVDILCLQEVHCGLLAEKIASVLEMHSWIHASGGLRPEYGGAVMSMREALLNDNTRYNGKWLYERVHMRVTLDEDGSRFVIAAVHLPSNRFMISAEEGDTVRIMELKRILTEPCRPDIVVGDMNCKPGSLPYRFMQEVGYIDAAEAAGCAHSMQCRIDYIWIDRKFENRLLSFSMLDKDNFVQENADGEIWRLSDHAPLLAEIK